MSSVFLEIAKLRELQTAIQSNPDARFLLRAVAQNAQTETFDLIATRTTLEASLLTTPNMTEAMNAVRILLVQYLEMVATFLTLHPLSENYDYGVPLQWMYENNTRLTKYLILAKYLEYVNLAAMDVKPMPDDIPQWALVLWRFTQIFQQSYKPKMAADYTQKLMATNPLFVSLCPESEHAAFEKRIQEFLAKTPQ